MPAFHPTEKDFRTPMRRACRFTRFPRLCAFGLLCASAVAASTVVTYPAGTLLENVAIGSAGTPEVYAWSLPADDFAFASDGSLFAATELVSTCNS
jgi:hypothetical protein